MKVTVVEEATQKVIFTCNTKSEAEAFIAGVEFKAPDEVHAGAYGINAPDTKDTP